MVWVRDFDRLTPFIAAFRPMLARQLESQVEETYNTMIKNWERGLDTTGDPWEPLAAPTLERGTDSTPLIETRQMIDGARWGVDSSSLSAVITIEDEEGKVLAHEHGVPDLGLPARPILAPTKQHIQQDADTIMKKAFDKSWAKATVAGVGVNVGFGGGARLGSTGRNL